MATATKAAEVDVIVNNHGSLYILDIRTRAAREWVNENVAPEGAIWWGRGGLVVEPGYVGDIVDCLISDGLEVR